MKNNNGNPNNGTGRMEGLKQQIRKNPYSYEKYNSYLNEDIGYNIVKNEKKNSGSGTGGGSLVKRDLTPSLK